MNQPTIEKDIFPELMLAPFHYACFVRYIGLCEDKTFLSHNCFQIVLGLSGTMQFKIKDDNQTIICGPGQVFILSPGTLHNWTSKQNEICENFMFFCDGFTEKDSDLGHILNLNKNDLALCFELKSSEYDFYIRQFRDLISSHNYCNINIMHGLLYAFCGTICRKATKVYGNLAGGNLHPALSKAIATLKRDFRKRFTLNKLSKTCNISPSRLSELFRLRFGISPIQYLFKLRIQKAEQLLNYSDMNISQIAEYLGFETVQYFSRFFKKQTGQSPKEILKKRKIV